MIKYFIAIVTSLILVGSNAYAEAGYSTPETTMEGAQIKIDDSELGSNAGNDYKKSPPATKSKKQLKKPKIGFKTTVRPEDMKSYNRTESGDVSAQ